MEQANMFKAQAGIQLNTLLKNIQLFIPEAHLSIDNSRSKRVLLPFVSELTRSLFGIVSDKDVNTSQHIRYVYCGVVHVGSYFNFMFLDIVFNTG